MSFGFYRGYKRQKLFDRTYEKPQGQGKKCF